MSETHTSGNGGESAVTVKQMVLIHDKEIDVLKAWRNELIGAFKLMRIALGTSILSAIISIVALAVMLGTGKP